MKVKEIMHFTDAPVKDDIWSGKNESDIVDPTQSTYAAGADKLRAEENKMLESVKTEYKAVMKSQLDLLFLELIRQTEQDAEFEKRVLLSHKSMERCMKFCSDKARELREPSDKEKEKARKYNVPIVIPVGSSMIFKWIREYYDKDETEKETKKKPEVKASNSRKKEIENQLSLFDLMGV